MRPPFSFPKACLVKAWLMRASETNVQRVASFSKFVRWFSDVPQLPIGDTDIIWSLVIGSLAIFAAGLAVGVLPTIYMINLWLQKVLGGSRASA